MMKKTAILCGWLALSPAAFGAIGCTLANPARDLKVLYPNLTSYREDVKELSKLPDGRAFVLSWPAKITADEYEDFEAWVSLLQRKLKRQIEQ